MESDAELIDRFLHGGDRNALDALFRRHVESVHRTARRILRNEAEADDATQSTFVAALRGLGSLHSPDRFAPWLRGILIRIARKSIRSSGCESRGRARWKGRSISPQEHAGADRDLEAVLRALDELPEDVRLPILLHHLEGLSYEEIGEALAMPRGTVGTNIHRGLYRLRSALPGTVSLGVLVAHLASSEIHPASAATVEAVSRLARSRCPSPRLRLLKAKAPLIIAAGAGMLLFVALAGRSSSDSLSAPAPEYRGTKSVRISAPAPDEPPQTTPEPPPAEEQREAPERPAEERITRNERMASAHLKLLLMSEADFRANDRDGNKVFDFWTADVSGLYRMGGGTDPREQIKLIPQEVAAADAAPLIQSAELAPPFPQQPSHGYWFRMLPVATSRDGRAPAEFAIAAYPAEYGRSGRRTFIINEGGPWFSKEMAGGWPPAWPTDPERQGWDKEHWSEPKPSPELPKPEDLTRVRLQASRLAMTSDLNRPFWDSNAHALSTVQEVFKIDPTRWSLLLTAHDRLIERAKQLERDRVQLLQSGDKTEIEILPFPQEANLLVAEWTRALESVLTPEQMRDFDERYASFAFPLRIGQHAVRITFERSGNDVRSLERVRLPGGEEMMVPGFGGTGAVPKPYLHLMR